MVPRSMNFYIVILKLCSQNNLQLRLQSKPGSPSAESRFNTAMTCNNIMSEQLNMLSPLLILCWKCQNGFLCIHLQWTMVADEINNLGQYICSQILFATTGSQQQNSFVITRMLLIFMNHFDNKCSRAHTKWKTTIFVRNAHYMPQTSHKY